MTINTNSPRSDRQLYDYDTFTRPPKYMHLCRLGTACLVVHSASNESVRVALGRISGSMQSLALVPSRSHMWMRLFLLICLGVPCTRTHSEALIELHITAQRPPGAMKFDMHNGLALARLLRADAEGSIQI